MLIPYNQRIYDTNKWHGYISWALPKENVPAVIAKAFDAPNSIEDTTFEYNWRRMKELGYKRGSYLFFWPKGKDRCLLQARRYVETLGSDLGDLLYVNRKGQSQPVLAVDVEMLSAYTQVGLAMPPRTPAIWDDLHTTLLEIERLTGIVPVIYSGPNDWKYYFYLLSTGQALWQDWIDDYYFWWSNPPYQKLAYPQAFYMKERIDYECYWELSYLYSSKPITYAPGVTEADVWAWQYSYKGRLPGVNADCDFSWAWRA